jgi:hypothetical protein
LKKPNPANSVAGQSAMFWFRHHQPAFMHLTIVLWVLAFDMAAPQGCLAIRSALCHPLLFDLLLFHQIATQGFAP